MKRTWTQIMALTAGMGVGVGHSTALAQENFASSEEIVVTAQLREQNILEVPIAVSAYSGESLDRLGITKFDDLSLIVPGLEVQEQSANNTGFVIRGITSDSGDATSEPRVAVFQDGVPASRNRGSYVELFDLERVEVSRGPQATLYGRGALIGAVNVIQNKADLNDFSLIGEAAGGDYEYGRALLVMNAPLVQDQFGLRLAATMRQREGFTENVLGGDDLGGVNVVALRASAAWAPTDAVRFDLIGNLHEDDNAGTAFVSGRYAACAPAGASQTCSPANPFGPAALNTFGGFENNQPLGLERGVYSVTLLGQFDLSPSFTLNSTSGYRYFRSFEVFDPDGFGLPLAVAAEDARGMQWSQDFRLSYDDGGPLTWFIGASYFEEDGRQRVPFMFDERVALQHAAAQITDTPQTYAALTDPAYVASVIELALGAPAGTGVFLEPGLQNNHTEAFTNFGETESVDIYADATLAVTDRLEISAGVRWTQDDKTTSYMAEVGGTGSLLGAALATGALPTTTWGLFTQPTTGLSSASDTFEDATWRLVARYALNEDVSLWASYARGRRPDVIAATGPATPLAAPTFSIVPAETVDSVEVGARARLQSGLNVEGSVYHYEYENFQTSQFSGAMLVTVNAGEASATGFEGQADWQITPWLDLFGTYAYSHARFDSGAREGNHFRLSPDHTLSLGAVFAFDVAGGTLSITPTYSWQSEVFFDDDNDDPALQVRSPITLSDFLLDERQDSYGLFNLRARYEAASGHWSVEAFANNLADEEYLIDAGNTGDLLGIPTFIRGAPRTIGLQVATRF